MSGICEFCGADLLVAKHDDQCAIRWKLPPHECYMPPTEKVIDRAAYDRQCERLKELESAGCALLEWDKKYPKGMIFGHGKGIRCESGLTDIIKRFREVLGDSKP